LTKAKTEAWYWRPCGFGLAFFSHGLGLHFWILVYITGRIDLFGFIFQHNFFCRNFGFKQH